MDNIRSLVCGTCWQELFNTDAWERMCRPLMYKGVQNHHMNVSAQHLKSNETTCSWCNVLYTWIKSLGWELREFFRVGSHLGGGCWTVTLYSKGEKQHMELSMMTPSNDPASCHILQKPMQHDVSLARTEPQILIWIEACHGHENCDRQCDTALPMRVIQVKQDGQPIPPRLLTTNGLKSKYATLSYCWGTGPSHHKSVRDNLVEYTKQLPLERLPQTIRDAIDVTRVLPVDYLWIDALCILQDCPKDKNIQLANMHSIYQNSFVTIAAASAADSHEGFLQHKAPSYDADHIECPIPYGAHRTVPFRVDSTDFGMAMVQCRRCEFSYDEGKEPIHQRAWTLQELKLPQRVLFYSSETLLWKCRDIQEKLEGGHLRDRWSSPFNPTGFSYIDKKPAIKEWEILLRSYCTRGLSTQTDRLPAVSAIAQRFKENLGPKYHAGLWQEELIQQLLWYSKSPIRIDPIHHVQSHYIAPTWSWASLGTTFSFSPAFVHKYTPLCKLLDIFTRPKSTMNPYGEIAEAHITLRGMLLEGLYTDKTAKISKESDSNSDTEDQTEYILQYLKGESHPDLDTMPIEAVCHFDYQHDLDAMGEKALQYHNEILRGRPIRCLLVLRDESGYLRIREGTWGLLLDKVKEEGTGKDMYRRIGVCTLYGSDWTDSGLEVREFTLV